MTHEEFDIAFKRFTRFLKECGNYKLIMYYLFPQGRSKEDMFEAINGKGNLAIRVSFSQILGFIHVIGPNYEAFGHAYWEKHIQHIYYEWLIKCREEYKEYLSYF